MEVIAILVGAGIVAVSPLVPALRPVAKSAVKGGMAITDASKGLAVSVASQWSKVASEAGAADDSQVEDSVEEVAIVEEDAAAEDVTAPEAPAVVKDVSIVEEAAAVRDVSVAEDVAVVGAVAAAQDIAVAEDNVGGELFHAEDVVVPITGKGPEGQESVAQGDDLTKIKGIGPKTQTLLKAAGISTYEQLAQADANELKAGLVELGRGYRVAEPDEWIEQARALAAGSEQS